MEQKEINLTKQFRGF